MKRAGYFAFLAIMVAGAFLAGLRYHQPSANEHNSRAGRQILYYVDPMHPSYKSDKPGIAPDCGMELVAVYADEVQPGSAQGARMRELDPSSQAAIGVRVSEVKREAGRYQLRLFGRVVPDESRVYKLNAGIDGFMQDVSPVGAGTQVKKNEVLASFSAPD